MTHTLREGSAISGVDANALLLFAACCVFVPTSAAGQRLPARAVNGIETADSLVSAEFAKDSIGSMTVGIIAGSRLVWTRSVGFADVKARRLANRNTVYRIGSITKPFTAVMLMQLIAAGKVQLSDPVERYLPEVRQIASRPLSAAPFTFLQLATMTGGLAREPEEAGPFWTGPVSEWEKKLFAALPHTRYQSSPGTEYSYSTLATRRWAPLSSAWRASHMSSGSARTCSSRSGWIAHGSNSIRPSRRISRLGMRCRMTERSTTRPRHKRHVMGVATRFRMGRSSRPSTTSHASCRSNSVAARTACSPDRSWPTHSKVSWRRTVASRPATDWGSWPCVAATISFPGTTGASRYRASMYFDRSMQLGVVLFRNVDGGKQEPDRLAIDILTVLATKKRNEIQADIDRRVKDQVASPGSAAAVRRLIQELRVGQPNYDLMSSAMARETRRQLTEQQAMIAKLGALQSVVFTRVGPAGPSIHRATFEKGALDWRVWMNLDGSVDVFFLRPVASAR